jgi:hypothetical protein
VATSAVVAITVAGIPARVRQDAPNSAFDGDAPIESIEIEVEGTQVCHLVLERR